MIATIICLAVALVVLAGALVAVVRQAAGERTLLIDVIVARHAGDLRVLRRVETAKSSAAQSTEVAAYEANRDAELKAMGYDPKDVPRVPAGLDGR